MEQQVLSSLVHFASQPVLVYSIVFVVMYASSFGLPIPEEITLITLGALAHMNLYPDQYAASVATDTGNVVSSGINVHTAAMVAFVAVFSSDMVVFMLGRFMGPRILKLRPVKKLLPAERMLQVEKWTERYGAWAGGFFRFTPGLRFPGHLSCGMLKVPVYKFMLVDGFAALISVPTQIYLVGFYGKEIIEGIKTYQPWIMLIVLLVVVFKMRKTILGFLRKKIQKA